MKKLLLSLLTAVVTCTFVWSQTTETLTTYNFWSNTNTYTSSKTSSEKFLGTTWVAANFNNNNNDSTWKQIRCGRAGNASVATITNSSAISETITKIVATVTFPKTGSLNSAKLYVSESSTFPTSSTSTFSLTSYSTAGDWEFTVPEAAVGPNKFYKLEFDCKSATSKNNGFLGITSLTFHIAATTPDVPTKCATPTFSVANGAKLYADDVLTIDCSTPNATITYEYGDVIEEVPAPAEIHFETDGDYTITAVASAEGPENSDEATISVTYTKEAPTFVTFDFVNKDYCLSPRGGSEYDKNATIKEGIVSIVLASGGGSGYRLWDDGLRLYKTSGKLNTMTISAANATITSVTVDYAAKVGTVSVNGATAVDASAGEATYQINSETAVLSYIVTDNKAIKTITVNYEIKATTAEDAELSFGETTEYAVPFGGEFDAPALVNPNNVAVTFSSEKESVAMVDAEGKVSIVGIGTTTIKAEPIDKDKYYGSASYMLNVQAAYSSIAEMLENASDGDKFIVNTPLTVGYANGANIYVSDGKGGYMLVYSKDNNYEALDVIPAGWSAEYAIYNGLPELKPVSLPAATEKGEYTIIKVLDPAEAALSQIVEIEEVVFESATETNVSTNFTGSINGNAWQFRNTHSIDAVEAGKYRVTLIASTYEKNATEIIDVNQLLPLKYEVVPAHPTVKVDDTDTEHDATVSLNGKEHVIVAFSHEDTENHAIFHKFVVSAPAEDTPAAQADDDNDGFVEYTEPIKITKAGTLHYYAQHKTSGTKSEVKSISFTGITSSIAEIAGAEAAETEYFDLQGRRVAANAKGIVIKKTGSKVSKVVF